jgi:hypothetical protein
MLKEAGFTYDESIGAFLTLAAGRVIAFDGAAQRTPEWSLTCSPASPADCV